VRRTGSRIDRSRRRRGEPSIRARSQTIPYDRDVYQERNPVERFANQIKHFRRIATRYWRTALSFASMLSLVGAIIWLR
jgi:transposase